MIVTTMMMMMILMMMMKRNSGMVVVIMPEMKGLWLGNRDPLGSCEVSICSFTLRCSGIQKGCRVTNFLFSVYYIALVC